MFVRVGQACSRHGSHVNVNYVASSASFGSLVSAVGCKEAAVYSAVIRMRDHSTKASVARIDVEPGQEIVKRKINDYTKYISRKSALREPSITRILTARSYKAGKGFISLAEGMPNETMFPFEEMKIRLKDGAEIILDGKCLSGALQYIPSRGLPQLVKTLKTFQKRMHNPPDWENRDLIVTSGSQDGIYKAMEMLVNRGDAVLMQSPLYSGTGIVMKPYQSKILEVKQDAEGLIPADLREVLSKCLHTAHIRPKILYVNPTGNNPTGTVTTNERRQEIYDIACEYDLIILEDDPYHFINFTDEAPKSFTSYDVEGRVLRFDSFSKVLSSGLRVGWVTGPKPLIDVIELHMQASYLHASSLPQMIVNKLFEVWGHEKMESHLLSVKDFYLEKRDCLLGLMEKHLTGLAEWETPGGGMFIWLKVKGVPDVYDMIFRKAFEKGVSFIPGHAFTVSSTAPCPYIRATFSRATPPDMETACIKLAELIREEQKIYASFTPIQ